MQMLKGTARENWRVARARLAQDRYMEELQNVSRWATDLQRELGFTRSEGLAWAEKWAENQRNKG
jgi:hypothetical protein